MIKSFIPLSWQGSIARMLQQTYIGIDGRTHWHTFLKCFLASKKQSITKNPMSYRFCVKTNPPTCRYNVILISNVFQGDAKCTATACPYQGRQRVTCTRHRRGAASWCGEGENHAWAGNQGAHEQTQEWRQQEGNAHTVGEYIFFYPHIIRTKIRHHIVFGLSFVCLYVWNFHNTFSLCVFLSFFYFYWSSIIFQIC